MERGPARDRTWRVKHPERERLYRPSPGKAIVGERPKPFGEALGFDPIASTLIFGENDAVLVDAMTTVAEAEALANWIALHNRMSVPADDAQANRKQGGLPELRVDRAGEKWGRRQVPSRLFRIEADTRNSITRDLPARGRIGIFNRAQLRRVLIARVHSEIPRSEGLPCGAPWYVVTMGSARRFTVRWHTDG